LNGLRGGFGGCLQREALAERQVLEAIRHEGREDHEEILGKDQELFLKNLSLSFFVSFVSFVFVFS
jgi:hypothetical protein